MRYITAYLAATAVALLLASLPGLRPLPLLASAISAVGLAALRRSGLLSAAVYVIAFALLALSSRPLLAPLAELAAFLSLYAYRLDELRRRLAMRGYGSAGVEAALSRAGLTVVLWSAAALGVSYLLYFALMALPRLPPAAAVALSAVSLAVILILSLGRTRG
ncbi:MAG: hypothetical protein ACP5I3_09600 [Thermoproteus sp.]